MEHFWNEEKNRILKKNRSVSFEQIVECINSTKNIKIIKHPNFEKYPNQSVYMINIDEYIYLVPFVEDGNKIFLKTIIPSRKATKQYLRGEKK